MCVEFGEVERDLSVCGWMVCVSVCARAACERECDCDHQQVGWRLHVRLFAHLRPSWCTKTVCIGTKKNMSSDLHSLVRYHGYYNRIHV